MTRLAQLAALTMALFALPASAAPLALRTTHGFSLQEARDRVQLMLEYWRDRYGLNISWSGPKAHVSGRMFGMEFEAELEVNDNEVAGELSDPGPFLRQPARDYVLRKLHKYLHPTFQEA